MECFAKQILFAVCTGNCRKREKIGSTNHKIFIELGRSIAKNYKIMELPNYEIMRVLIYLLPHLQRAAELSSDLNKFFGCEFP